MNRKRSDWHWVAYDSDWDRWAVHMDGQTYDLHCGECFRIRIGGYGMICRMEYDQDWYVIMDGASFILRQKNRYQVQLR